MNDLIKPLQAALGLKADGVRGPVTTAAILDAADRGFLRVERPAPVAETLPWMKVARSYLGTKEIVGPVDNPKIVELFALSGHSWVQDDETAWCAAFVGGVLAKVGIKGTQSLSARSYEKWGQLFDGPAYGCVGVKKRVGGSWLGHVGFVVAANASKITLLGGNQNNEVSMAEFNRSEFTAFLYPPSIARPVPPLPLPASLAEARAQVSEA